MADMRFTVDIALHEAFINKQEDIRDELIYIAAQVGNAPKNEPWTDKRQPIMDNGVEVGTWGFVGTGRVG